MRRPERGATRIAPNLQDQTHPALAAAARPETQKGRRSGPERLPLRYKSDDQLTCMSKMSRVSRFSSTQSE